ncbi:hypothetical protein MHBO_001750 [Bonamia ostreae]|uniref:Uncharacterized protein n=1 Tax=Bonamia ostreae TaxID=126728 RepID=A0ABV2AK23_9EUKA
MNKILTNKKIYFVDKIDFEDTVFFDQNGTAIFNLIQCEFNPSEDNKTSLRKNCFFFLRSVLSLYTFTQSKPQNLFKLLSAIKNSLLNGEDFLYKHYSKFDFGFSILPLCVDDQFYFYRAFCDQPFKTSHFDGKARIIKNSSYKMRVAIFEKNSFVCDRFMKESGAHVEYQYRDWKYVYVVYEDEHL